MRFSSRQIFGAVLILLELNVAFMAWRVLDFTFREQGIGDLWMPILWFSLLVVTSLVGMIVWQNRILQVAGVLAVFLPSLFFVCTFVHGGMLLISFLTAFLAARSVQGELHERLSFRFTKSIRAGQGMFLFALVLSLSSFYYAEIRGASWEELVPRFHIGEGATKAVFRVVGNLNPEFASLKEEGITVDDFLESIYEDRKEGLTEEFLDQEVSSPDTGQNEQIVSGGMALVRELSLRSGREQLSRLAGREVRGDERVSDVFSYAVQRKVIATLSGEEEADHLAPQAVPLLLSLLLFLTLLPLASLLMYVWALVAHLVVFLAFAFRWLHIKRVASEQETLQS